MTILQLPFNSRKNCPIEKQTLRRECKTIKSALYWLVNNSELYKNSDIAINDSWFQEVTESAEDTVREFLEAATEQTNGNNGSESQVHEQNGSAIAQDWTEMMTMILIVTVRIDANDRVGNVDTLVGDADIENKYDQVLTFALGEGQHPLSLHHGKDAEYLCFPSIFCGERQPGKKDRSFHVHFGDIVT